LQSYFIKRVEKILERYSKKLIGWDEILEGGLAPNAAVMSWRGEEGGIQAARSGHYVVMSPNSQMYFDHYQGEENEPLAIGGLTTLDEVYAYDPVPHDLDSASRHFVIGVQSNIWSEYISNANHLQYMIFPRLCALAEIAWTMPQRLDKNDFLKRMSAQYARLDAEKINYRLAPPAIASYIRTIEPSYMVEFLDETPGTDIRYTLDGTLPNENSALYSKAFELELKGKGRVKLISATFLKNGKRSQPHTTILEQVGLRAPEDVKISGNGLRYQYYEGTTNSAENISAILMKRGRVYAIAYPEKARAEHVAIILETVFNAQESGMYTFYTYSDDGSMLWIGNEKVVDNDGDHGARKGTGQIALSKGLHRLRIAHYQGSGGLVLEAGYSIGKKPFRQFAISELFLEIKSITTEKDSEKTKP